MQIDPNHFQLSTLGSFFPLNITFEYDKLIPQIESFREAWVPYNPRKQNFNRFGLSLFSLDGGMSGRPDLDSIYEFNKENGTDYTETSFKTPTAAWKEISEISTPFREIENSLCRSHILRLDTAGIFPPHRDLCMAFRLISFANCSPEHVHLSLDGQLVNFQPYRVYFLDTHKTHSLVSFQDDAYILVLNVMYDSSAIDFVQNHRMDI